MGKDVRLAEAARSLNALSSASAAAARHDSWHVLSHSKTGPGHGPTLAQRSILDGMRDRIAAYGAPPVDLSGQQALHSLLKSDDSYVLGAKNLAPYQPDLLKVAKSNVLPKKATELLPPDTSKFLLHPDKFIIRSDSEMSEWRSRHPSFRPYWGPTLAGSRQSRLDLYHTLAAKGLLVLKKRIKCRCGVFFVWKSGRKGIRLIIDAREANASHRRPPKAFLGSASAISELQIDSEVGGFAEVSLPGHALGDSAPLESITIDGATGDVSDAFYQFSVEHMAEWFGLDDPVEPFEIGLEGSYEPG